MMILVVFASFISAQAIFAQGLSEVRINQMGNNGQRYSAVQPFEQADWSVFGSQLRYNPATPEMLNGYQKSTAAEQGVSEVWNEVGNNIAVRVKLNPNEVVLYMGDQYYLDNCRWFISGKWVEFKNRIRPIVQSTPPQPIDTVVEIPLPEFKPFQLTSLIEFTPVVIPPLPPPPIEGQAVVLVYDHKGKSWVWKYTPLWCVDVRRPRDLWHPAACAAVAAGGYWLAGGFSGLHLFKAAACVATKLPNGTMSVCPP